MITTWEKAFEEETDDSPSCPFSGRDIRITVDGHSVENLQPTISDRLRDQIVESFSATVTIGSNND